jgi:glycerol dehydrogenase
MQEIIDRVAATHGLAHGQKVNIGSVAQLVLEGAPAGEILDFIEFTTRVGLAPGRQLVDVVIHDIEFACLRGKSTQWTNVRRPRPHLLRPQSPPC